jgi:hypothetical protein
MRSPFRSRPSVLLAALLVFLGLAPWKAAADGGTPDPTAPQPGAPGEAAAPRAGRAGVVKLDIIETIDGKESKVNAAVYYLEKTLGSSGYTVWATREPKGKESNPRPDPDLVIAGKVDCKKLRESTFYGGTVGVIYETTAEVTIADKAGKTLATVKERDEWGRREKKDARDECLKRLVNWLAAAVLKEPAIQGRLDDAGKKAADEYLKKVETARTKKPPEEESGEDGDEGAGGGK